MNKKKDNKVKMNVNPTPKKNLPWAVATWHLFHIIPARISEYNFRNNREIILNFIKICCSKLPCPYCKNHAQHYLRQNMIERNKTKEDLEKYLFIFHNSAHRVQKNIQWENCMPQYKTMNINQVFYKFEAHFFQSFIGGRYFSDWIRNDFKEDYYKFRSVMLKILN